MFTGHAVQNVFAYILFVRRFPVDEIVEILFDVYYKHGY